MAEQSWALQPIHVLDALRRQGQVSAREITQAVLDRMEAVEGQVRAFLLRTPEAALQAAEAADARQARGELRSALDGMPIALKDIFTTEGLPTTCGSRILEGFIPPYDATVTARLKAAGCALVGKTNLDEFAMGSSTEHSAFGPSHNPWALDRTPGGSSGGSAAAVAAGECLAALGTDTGGSVRQPAAYTGLVGLKPTYGRVSRYGMIAFASSFDVAGVLCRSVRDAALILGAIAGHDAQDSTCAATPPPPDYLAALNGQADLKGLRVGTIREFEDIQGVAPAVKECFAENLRQVEALGAEIQPLSLPHLKQALGAYYILAPAEASSNLGRYDGIRYGLRAPNTTSLETHYRRTRAQGFGPEVKRRIMLGVFCLSAGYHDAYYAQAMRVRQLLRQDFAHAFQQVHLLLSPATPTPAFRLGEVTDPLQMYLQDIFTLPANLAGIPALSLPAGFAQHTLPLGLQLLAPHFAEAALLNTAHTLERSLHPNGIPTAPL